MSKDKELNSLAQTAQNTKVEQLKNSRTGRPVANHFVIKPGINGVEFLQSYSTIVAMINDTGLCFCDRDFWDYSPTTVKYVTMFLGLDSAKDLRRAIKHELVQLTQLNKEGHRP